MVLLLPQLSVTKSVGELGHQIHSPSWNEYLPLFLISWNQPNTTFVKNSTQKMCKHSNYYRSQKFEVKSLTTKQARCVKFQIQNFCEYLEHVFIKSKLSVLVHKYQKYPNFLSFFSEWGKNYLCSLLPKIFFSE